MAREQERDQLKGDVQNYGLYLKCHWEVGDEETGDGGNMTRFGWER